MEVCGALVGVEVGSKSDGEVGGRARFMCRGGIAAKPTPTLP